MTENNQNLHHQQPPSPPQRPPVDAHLVQRLNDLYLKNLQHAAQSQQAQLQEEIRNLEPQQQQLQLSPSLISQIRAAQQQQQQQQQNGHIEVSSMNGMDSNSIPIIKSKFAYIFLA